MSVQTKQDSTPVDNPPWWRLPIVWMVIGGPLAVVVACGFTVSLAVRHVDPVLDTAPAQVKSVSELPAIKGRNMAASPDQVPLDE